MKISTGSPASCAAVWNSSAAASAHRRRCCCFPRLLPCWICWRRSWKKKGIRYYLLTGATAKEKRHADVERFQKDDTPLFMISLKAGGTGLNLTAAEVVIHFDPWWTPVCTESGDRSCASHRSAQQAVQVYQLIMKGTIEERIRHLQEKKKDLADLFVRTQNENLLRFDEQGRAAFPVSVRKWSRHGSLLFFIW